MRPPDDNECIVDFCDEKDFSKIPEKTFKIIINVAGIVDQYAPKDLMMEINAEGTRRMCEWALKHDCRHFIQISSVSAYGFKLLGEDRAEDNTKRNKGFFGIPYSQSKAKAERYIEKSGLSGYTMLRFPPILGRNDSYITPTIVPRLLNDEWYFSTKKDKKYSTMYIKNIGPLVSNVIEAGPQNEAFNCTGYEMTWRDYVYEYARQLDVELEEQYQSIWKGLKNWDDKQILLMLGYCYFGAHYPNDKLKDIIGFEPKYSWKEGVADAIEGYFEREEQNSMQKTGEMESG